MNSLPRSLIVALATAVLVPLAGGVWFYRVQELRLRHKAEEQLQTVVQLKVDQVAEWRAERLADAAVLTESPFLAQAVDRFLTEPQARGTEEMLVRLHSLQKHYHYKNALLVDAERKLRLSLSEQPGVLRSPAQTLANALREGKPALSDLQIEMDDPTPHICVIAPLFVSQGQSRKPLGAVILVCDVRRFLYPLIQSWPTPSQTAEMLLVRRDGDDVLFLNDLRHQPNTAFKLRIPLTQTDVPSVMAALGQEGVVEGRDHRGVKVVSALKPVPGSPWFMIAQMDSAEISATWRVQAVLILAATLAIVTAAAASVLLVWNRQLNTELEQRVRQRTAQLAKSDEQVRLLVEHVVDYAIVSLDAEGRVVSWNIGAERITGYQSSEIIGRNFARFYCPEDQAAGKPAALLREAEVHSRTSDEGWRVRKDGSRFWGEVVLTPIRHEDGRLRGFSAVTRDVTERKRAEEALWESEKRQAEAEKLAATGRMAARVAHEINNPLAGIRNSFRLIRDAVPEDHPDRDMVERIDREIERIASIVREMYTLYSPRAKETADIVVADAVRDVLVMLEPLRREHNVQFDATRIRPGLTVRISEGGLHQILYNLVTNAAEASPPGSDVVLAAEPIRGQDGADLVEITVRDHGVGILPEFHHRIFEPFFTSKADDGSRSGLGVGLSVLKSIIESARGRIEFESTPGQGTVFHVFLCRCPDAQGE